VDFLRESTTELCGPAPVHTNDALSLIGVVLTNWTPRAKMRRCSPSGRVFADCAETIATPRPDPDGAP
jgi:hypothetical protein